MLYAVAESKVGLWYPKLLVSLFDSIICRGSQSPVDKRYSGVPESEKWGTIVRIWIVDDSGRSSMVIMRSFPGLSAFKGS